MDDFDGGLYRFIIDAFSFEDLCAASFSESVIFMSWKDKVSYWILPFFEGLSIIIDLRSFRAKIHSLKVVVYFLKSILLWVLFLLHFIEVFIIFLIVWFILLVYLFLELFPIFFLCAHLNVRLLIFKFCRFFLTLYLLLFLIFFGAVFIVVALRHTCAHCW